MKELFKIMYVAFFFKKGYTTMPRFMEISFGIVLWLNSLMLIYGILKIINIL